MAFAHLSLSILFTLTPIVGSSRVKEVLLGVMTMV